MSGLKQKTYVAVVKKAMSDGKNKTQMLKTLQYEFPEKDITEMRKKLNATIKYIATSLPPKIKKTKKIPTKRMSIVDIRKKAQSAVMVLRSIKQGKAVSNTLVQAALNDLNKIIKNTK